jgi:hypothetical protein
MIMWSVSKHIFSSFPIVIHLFPYLIALARGSCSMMLKRSDKKEHPCLAPNPSEKVSSFSHQIWCFMDFFFIKLRNFPSIPNLSKVFTRCWTLPNASSAFIKIFLLCNRCNGWDELIFKCWTRLHTGCG